MITVVIIGILSTIAMAQYEEYIMRSQATEVYTAAIVAKSGMEQNALNNHGIYSDMSSQDFYPQINELRYFNDITCSSTNTGLSNGQFFQCSVKPSATSAVNAKLRSVTYTFDNTGTVMKTDGGSSGWPSSSTCFVMSKGGC